MLALAAAIGWAAPASAHTALVSSSPAAGATVEAPASVSLTFNEALLDIGAQIVVLDAEGGDHATGDVFFPEPSTVRVDVAPLGPGSYTAQWRVVSADGHPIEGSLPFTVATVAPVATVAASPSPSAAATPIPAPTPTPLIPPGPGDDHLGGLVVMIAVMIGAIVLIGAAVFCSIPKDSLTGSRRRARS